MHQIRDLEQMNVSITKIKIGNLGVDNVIPLIAEALRMEDNDIKVKSLAETIHKKTEGNPFFVLMFLRSLYDEKLLEYSFGAMKWTWDDDAVNSKIVTENVASVLVNKMNRLQKATQKMLMVASCLGATFRLSAVIEIIKNISQAEMRASMRVSRRSIIQSDENIGNSFSPFLSHTSFASSIEELQEEGLCEVDNEEGHFVHDQIQSAAFKLICPDQRDLFRGKIGRILLERLSPEELEDSLFEVVGLLNCAVSKMTDTDLDDLARMNLKAGIKASENAAFDAATVYFQAGREALGSRGWEGDHGTMLNLCSHAANAYFVTGDFDSMNEIIAEVLSKDIDAKEKFRVSDIKARSLASAGKLSESIDVALDFRRQLGLPTLQKKPVSKFTIIREYLRVKRLLKNKTAEDIASLPALDDRRYEMGLIMNEHLAASVSNFEPTMLPLIIFQGVTTALKHGIGSTSSSYFAGLGMLLCGPFGKPHEGLEMAKAAELIIEMRGKLFQSGAVYTLFRTQGLCYHWTSPLQDTLAPLLKGYQVGLETGDNERAIWCLIIRSYHLYFIGRPLDSIQKELEATISVLTQLKQDDSKLKITIVLTTVKKLRGIDAEAGDKILDSVLAAAASTGNVTLSAYVNLFKLEVFVFFQQWREALDLVLKAGDVRLFINYTFPSVRYTFLEALTYLKASQSASGWKNRQLKKVAHKSIQLIRSWAKNGNVNVVHYLQILEAELALLNGKNKKTKEKFKAAITTSSRNGFLQDRALAHELVSAYFKAQGDDNWGNYHIVKSRTSYQEWGCSEKVKRLDAM